MTRRSHKHVDHSAGASTGRKRLGRRILTLGTLGMITMMVLTACGPDADKPYSTLSPASPTADDIQSLYKLVFWLALFVFVGVQFVIVYTALRFRRTKLGKQRPPQVHGNKRLEIVWTVIPAVVLLVVLIPTITTLYKHADAAEAGDIEITVYGKQWWWEVQYGADNRKNQDLGVVTANEIHIPVGKEVVFNLESNNVIHSFWVPRLSGKIDVVPGHSNRISITADEPGEYFGECAELCGAQHAWMRFRIVAEPVDQFYAWVNAEKTGNPGSTSADGNLPEGVAQVPAAFNVCLSCHSVNGVSQSPLVGLDAPANLGPNLTNLMCRDTIAAGMLANNRDNLVEWVNDPGSVKPGNYMAAVVGPGMIRQQFGDDGFNALIDYLLTLQPAGGCDNPTSATPVASPVASPVATPTS